MKYSKYCSYCGTENYPLLKYCINCGSVLKSRRIKDGAEYNDSDTFFTNENLSKLVDTELTEDIYNKIIRSIRDMGLMNLNRYSNEPCLNKLIKLVKQYSKVGYDKADGVYGYYNYNSIYIDNDLNESMKICTLIHELSHHLFSEIFEQLIMYFLDSRKTDFIEGFVAYMVLIDQYHKVANEYLAYTCEGYFTNNIAKDYESVVQILAMNNLDSNIVEQMYVLGNSIADDIINILKTFFDENFLKEINYIFKKDHMIPSTGHSELNNKPKYKTGKEKMKAIKSIIINTFNELSQSPSGIITVYMLSGNFEQANRG